MTNTVAFIICVSLLSAALICIAVPLLFFSIGLKLEKSIMRRELIRYIATWCPPTLLLFLPTGWRETLATLVDGGVTEGDSKDALRNALGAEVLQVLERKAAEQEARAAAAERRMQEVAASNAAIRRRAYIATAAIAAALFVGAHMLYWFAVISPVAPPPRRARCKGQPCSLAAVPSIWRMWAMALINLAIFCVIEVAYAYTMFAMIMLLDVNRVNRDVMARVQATRCAHRTSS